MPAEPGDSQMEKLERWIAAGGEWCVEHRAPDGVTVALLTCDGGEVMERITSGGSGFVEYVEAEEDGRGG